MKNYCCERSFSWALNWAEESMCRKKGKADKNTQESDQFYVLFWTLPRLVHDRILFIAVCMYIDKRFWGQDHSASIIPMRYMTAFQFFFKKTYRVENIRLEDFVRGGFFTTKQSFCCRPL